MERCCVATSLWAKCEGEAHTPKSGNLESSGTPEISELELKGQNTLHWGVLGVVGKLSTRATTLVQTSSRSELGERSYGSPKSRESELGQFRDSTLGVPGKRAIWM